MQNPNTIMHTSGKLEEITGHLSSKQFTGLKMDLKCKPPKKASINYQGNTLFNASRKSLQGQLHEARVCRDNAETGKADLQAENQDRPTKKDDTTPIKKQHTSLKQKESEKTVTEKMRNADEVLVLRKKQQDVNNSQSAVHQRSGDDTVAVASVAQPTESQSSVTTSSKNQINISQPVTQIEMCTINEHTQHNMGMIGSNNVSTPPSLINTQTFNQSGYEENQSYNQYENLQVTSAESHSAFNHVMPQNSSLSNFSNDGDVSWNMSCGGFYHSTPSRPDPWATPCTSINTSDVMGSAYGSLYGQPRNSQCHSSCSCCGTVAALLRRVEMLEQAEEARQNQTRL